MVDGAMPTNSREYSIKGTSILISIMAKYGITVYAGIKVKKSKTKDVFFPGA